MLPPARNNGDWPPRTILLISQIFVDPQLTPEALDKAAEVLEKLGEKEKADNLREQLKTRYPTYKRKE